MIEICQNTAPVEYRADIAVLLFATGSARSKQWVGLRKQSQGILRLISQPEHVICGHDVRSFRRARQWFGRRTPAAAQRAIQDAVSSGAWEQVGETLFETPVYFRDFAAFETRLIGITYLDHRLDDATLQRVRARFEPHMVADGAHFVRPMRVNLLRKC